MQQTPVGSVPVKAAHYPLNALHQSMQELQDPGPHNLLHLTMQMRQKPRNSSIAKCVIKFYSIQSFLV